MSKKSLLLAATAITSTLFAAPVNAQQSEPAVQQQQQEQQQSEPDVIQQRIDAVQKKYAGRLDALKADGDQLAADQKRPGDIGGAIGVDVQISSHREDWYVKIPEFWTGRQRIVLTVPEFVMRRQRIVFDTPSVRMKTVQVGVHPEWFGLWHMEWKPNYMDVPEPFMQRQEIILDLPEIKMRDQAIILDLPQVAMREQHWSFDVPDFKVVDVHAEMNKAKDRANDLESRGKQTSTQMQVESNQILNEELPKKREQLVARFDEAAKSLQDAIAAARKVNMDTSKPSADGAPALDDLVKDLENKRAQALHSIDEQIAKAKGEG
jgi:hypothetical protein